MVAGTYSANRSIRNQHQQTFLDRRKLSRFFSGTICAPPSTLQTEASVTNTKKHSQTGDNSRDCFLGLFEHLHVLCLKKHAETATKSVKLPPQFGGGDRSLGGGGGKKKNLGQEETLEIFFWTI